jgi:ParB family chromosome partitioning protein
MTDDQLVVAQGIENTARRDLSYIERAAFAASLESHGFKRDVIMEALSTDKTELSKLLSVAKAIPAPILKAIGPAPSAGRRRWMEIADKIADGNILAGVKQAIQRADFEALGSDERFGMVLAAANKKPKTETSGPQWKPTGSKVAAQVKDSGKALILSLKASGSDTGFGRYLADRLDDLYADWKSKQET